MSTCKSYTAFCQTRERGLTNPCTPWLVKTGDIESPWVRKLVQVKRKPLLTPVLHVRVFNQPQPANLKDGWMIYGQRNTFSWYISVS
jgi:hypothetical protein